MRLLEQVTRRCHWLAGGTLMLAVMAGCGMRHRDLPLTLDHLPRTHYSRGIGGLGSISHLRDVGVELESGAFAIYGLRSASLWVATTRDSASAQKAVQLLMLRIEKGDTPFRTNEAVSIEGREVRELSGLGQRHFVFTAGRRLVWLAANRDHADSSLSQVLRFYR